MAKAPDSDLSGMTATDLREKAKEEGLTGVSHMRKDELVNALEHESGDSNGAAAGGENAISLLKRDHQNVKALFKKALEKETGDASIEPLAKQIIAELTVHAEAEEKLFYPALKAQAVSQDEDKAKDGVLEAYVEHASVKELIAKIQKSSARDESYKAMVQVMSEQVEHHVEEEEGEMFKQAQKLLGTAELEKLGGQIAQMKAGAKA